MLKKELRNIREWRDELEREGELISIEETSGIYLIRMPDNFKIDIRPSTDAIDVYKERSMLYEVERLKDKWKIICHGEVDNKIVYIGKADRNNRTKRNLRKRVTELIKYGYGECNNHRGGRRNPINWAFARPLKVLATLGNRFFAGVGKVEFLIC